MIISTQVDAPETGYNERVVLFLRQPNIFDVLKEKTGSVPKSIRDKVNAIRHDGTTALDRLSCDVELTMILRLDFELHQRLLEASRGHLSFSKDWS